MYNAKASVSVCRIEPEFNAILRGCVCVCLDSASNLGRGECVDIGISKYRFHARSQTQAYTHAYAHAHAPYNHYHNHYCKQLIIFLNCYTR